MFEIARVRGVAIKRNGCAGEVQSASVQVRHNFHCVRIGYVDVGGGRHQSANLGGTVFHHLDQSCNLLRANHGLISLDIEVDIGGDSSRDLVHSLGAAAVSG